MRLEERGYLDPDRRGDLADESEAVEMLLMDALIVARTPALARGRGAIANFDLLRMPGALSPTRKQANADQTRSREGKLSEIERNKAAQVAACTR